MRDASPAPRNPWLTLPAHPSYVLGEDVDALKAGRILPYLDLRKLPAPFAGDPAQARVCLLTLRPAWRPEDAMENLDGYLVEQVRRSLAHASAVPFVYLDRRLAGSGGGIYWRRRLAPLLDAASEDLVAQHLFVANWFPYSITDEHAQPVELPSQGYVFEVVRRMAAASVPIVLLNSERRWTDAIPELAGPDSIRPRSWRASTVSPGNLREAEFERLVAALRR
jgi:hypothetical protein